MKKNLDVNKYPHEESIPENLKNEQKHDSTNIRKIWFYVLLILTVTIFVYRNVPGNELLNWDDDLYITNNKDIQSLNSNHFKNLVTKVYIGNYHPLTMLVYAAVYQIDGLNPQTFHWTSIVFHLLNIILVFVFIYFLLGMLSKKSDKFNLTESKRTWIAIITSALFALHPINVESVAWIAELKNVLFTFFYLLSLIFYLRYLENKRVRVYILVVLMFLFSVLSKATAVTLPFILVSIDYLLKRDWYSKKAILEKVPFILLSVFFGIMAIFAQNHDNAIGMVKQYAFYEKFAIAGYGFVYYLFKLLIPNNFYPFYPYPESLTFIYWTCLFIFICLVIVFLVYLKKLPGIVIFSILFFVINIALLLQIIPVGSAIMADRYVYLGSIGIFLLFALTIITIIKKPVFLKLMLSGYFVFICIYTNLQTGKWQSKLVFWDNLLSMYDNIPKAWLNRGVANMMENRLDEAIQDFQEALKHDPELEEAHNNIGVILFNSGYTSDAISSFDKAIEIKPLYSVSYCNRGAAKLSMGDTTGALSDFNKSIEIDSVYLKPYINRVDIYLNKGLPYEVITDCNAVLQFDPENGQVYNYRARAKYELGNFPGASEDFSKAIQYEPENLDNYQFRGISRFYSGDYKNAIIDFDYVLIKTADWNIALLFKGLCYIKSGDKNTGCDILKLAKNIGLPDAQIEYDNYCQP